MDDFHFTNNQGLDTWVPTQKNPVPIKKTGKNTSHINSVFNLYFQLPLDTCMQITMCARHNNNSMLNTTVWTQFTAASQWKPSVHAMLQPNRMIKYH